MCTRHGSNIHAWLAQIVSEVVWVRPPKLMCSPTGCFLSEHLPGPDIPAKRLPVVTSGCAEGAWPGVAVAAPPAPPLGRRRQRQQQQRPPP
jgi:hypothetical protein